MIVAWFVANLSLLAGLVLALVVIFIELATILIHRKNPQDLVQTEPKFVNLSPKKGDFAVEREEVLGKTKSTGE